MQQEKLKKHKLQHKVSLRYVVKTKKERKKMKIKVVNYLTVFIDAGHAGQNQEESRGILHWDSPETQNVDGG